MEYNEAVNQFFIDYKKTYHSVRWNVLYNILIAFGIPIKLLKLIKMSLTETCSRDQLGKNSLSSLHFNFALVYAIRNVQVNQDGLKLNGTLQFRAYAVHVNILGRSLHTVKEKAATLIDVSKEIGMEVNADKNMHMVMYPEQDAGQIHSMKTDNISFEMVQVFKYLGTNLTIQNPVPVRKKLRAD